MKPATVTQIVGLLERKYGAPRLQPNHQAVAELVQTILSQNTSDANSRPAFRTLVARFPTWEEVLQADTSEVAESIRAGGLGSIKAQRIQKALAEIKQRQGVIDLDFLDGMSVPEAREWLMRLPGVGNKTANCVLLFALGKPALPVDTHIFRVSKRLRLIPERASLDEAHQKLGLKVPQPLVYSFHVLMIEHGRKTCIAQRPRCQICVLNEICPSYSEFVIPAPRTRSH
jgi:endonuclease-3